MHHRTAASTFNCQPDTLENCAKENSELFG
jgi:hypothetical protein